jgi:hypothetical protein
MVRYADDFVVLCRSRQEAAEALAVARDWTAQAGLTLHAVNRSDCVRGHCPLAIRQAAVISAHRLSAPA